VTFNINAHTLRRIAAVTAATVGVGAAAFFGGQATRMSDSARANERNVAVLSTTAKLNSQHADEMASAAKAAKAHERHAIRKAIKAERKRAAKLAERARSEGYSSGNSAGYASGNSAGYASGNSAGYASGHSDGYSEGNDDGYTEGNLQATTHPTCSDDPDVTDLPYC
jgi:flagellar biosynthesis/type III secretory pathway protein FliH